MSALSASSLFAIVLLLPVLCLGQEQNATNATNATEESSPATTTAESSSVSLVVFLGVSVTLGALVLVLGGLLAVLFCRLRRLGTRSRLDKARSSLAMRLNKSYESAGPRNSVLDGNAQTTFLPRSSSKSSSTAASDASPELSVQTDVPDVTPLQSRSQSQSAVADVKISPVPPPRRRPSSSSRDSQDYSTPESYLEGAPAVPSRGLGNLLATGEPPGHYSSPKPARRTRTPTGTPVVQRISPALLSPPPLPPMDASYVNNLHVPRGSCVSSDAFEYIDVEETLQEFEREKEEMLEELSESPKRTVQYAFPTPKARRV